MARVAEASTEYIRYRLEVFIAVFTIFQIIAVVLLFYARSLTIHKYAVCDWLIEAALIGQVIAGGIAIDVIMLILPMTIIWKLHTSTALRVALVTIFLFGNIGLITSIMRFVAF
ncbi:putative Integral membrane protein [Seiridium cardinale]